VILLGALLWPTLEKISTSFPEIFLGQVVLTRESKPLSPRAYYSAELVLNQVSAEEIEQAAYIHLGKDVLFWGPQYVGFRRTPLSADEIHILLQALTTGNLFYPSPDGYSFECFTRDASQAPRLETCLHGRAFQDQFTTLQWEAEQNEAVGVLQFALNGGRLAEIRVYPSSRGLAYTPSEITGDWWLSGVSASLPDLEALAARAAIPSIQVQWPELTAAQANQRAARFIGDQYQPALEIVQKSHAVQEVFGVIQEIRPAVGDNRYMTWMDATSVFLTLRVIGSRGQGAVFLEGYDCFNLQMVFNGQPVEDGTTPICP
jgi:hypothetical protein